MSEEEITDLTGEVVDADFAEVGESAVTATADPAFEPFSLNRERFTLANINNRTEKHGDERVPALDLKFSATLSNSILLKLHPGLRDAFYVQDRQRDIEADYGRKLRFPLIGTIPYDLEIPRVRLRVHDCDSEKNDVVLIDGEANKFRLTPMDGGSVAISFRVQFSEYEPEALAALALVQQQVVPISLSAEVEEEQPPTIEDQVEKATQKPKSAARLAADAYFDEPDDPTLGLPFIPPVPEAQPEAAAEGPAAESNVTPIKTGRKNRAANGAE